MDTEIKGFTFDEATHSYLLDGRPLTGVTTILGVIAKPALIQWAANTAVDFIKDNYNHDLINDELWDKLLKDAKTAHRKKKEAAADIGTKAHKWIEAYIKASINNDTYSDLLMGAKEFRKHLGLEPLPLIVSPLPKVEKDIKIVTDQFVKWVTDNNIKFLESEKRVYSRENWYAGTCDLVFIKDGKKYVGDIKTSSGIYGREYFFQMAGYQIALEELGERDFFASTIIRCGKDGSFEVKDSFDLESDKSGFLSALKLYRELEKS